MVDVTLPSLGESVTEGVITRWFKKVGDVVARDEPLFEVSTDKVDSEMPSPAAGVLVEIVAAEGDTVATGSKVAVINDQSATDGTTSSGGAQSVAPKSPVPDIPPTRDSPPFDRGEPVTGGVVLSPVVRRILADGGVTPSSVLGTGPGGAVTRRDAERAVAQGPSEEAVVPLSNGLRRMGQHMAASSQQTPHGFVAVEVDARVFADLAKLGRVTREGIAISDEMLVAVAAVRALGEFEFLNATLLGEDVVVHRSVNLGVVRTLADDGMLVPVVHAAAGLTLRALARRISELDQRVASRQLTADDLMGGTFTVAGAPTEHTLWTAPIIIQPQVAVLSAGAVRETAVVTHLGATATVEVGHRVVLGLSFDHRVCDARVAARYLERVSELLAGLDLESER